MRTFLVVDDVSLAVVGWVEGSGFLSALNKTVERTVPPYQPNGRLSCWPCSIPADIERARRLRLEAAP